MKVSLLIIGGFLMGSLCVIGLLWGWPAMWVLCPQALVVMFVRQWHQAYDSLGAADYPDLAVGALYYPIIAWFIYRALKRDRLGRIATLLALLHIAAIGLAWAAAGMRNRIWAIG